MPTINDLRQRQALPLEAKVQMSKIRIREWYNHWNGDVYVSFSGGKDSTVLAHLVHDLYPNVPLVFSNTGLEYPEIQAFARKMGAEFLRPNMRFDEVISKYGYPIIGKEVSDAIYYARIYLGGAETQLRRKDFQGRRQNDFIGEGRMKRLLGLVTTDGGDIREENNKNASSMFNKTKWLPLCINTQFKISANCCMVMKKSPLAKYEKVTNLKPYLGLLTDESRLREQKWLKTGCNAFDSKHPKSRPISFWKENDVLQYIKDNNIEIASVYGDIVAVDKNGFCYEPIPGIECKLKCTKCQRTGCIFCAYGAHLEKGETRFQRLAKTHPKQYDYCLGGGQWVDNPDYDPTAPKMDGDWVNWNPKKIWVPSKKGLGMKKVFDDCNAIYGKDFIRYE